MPTERESNDVKKAMAYDLLKIVKNGDPDKTYTAKEIEEIVDAYIAGLTQ